LPDMPISTYSKGVNLKALKDTEVCAKVIKPYFESVWTGLHANYYNPPEMATNLPFLTLNRNVAHFSHAIFTGYKMWAPLQLRKIFSNVLNYFLKDPVLKTENLPSFTRAFVTVQDGRHIVHVLAYLPEKRGQDSEIIEDEIAVPDGKIALRADGRQIRRVYLAPDCRELKFQINDGYVEVELPLIKGYAMVVFE